MAAKRAHRPPEAPPLDWFVFTRKTSLMQRLADLVRSGHRWFVAGTIAPERAGLLAGKFDAHYQVTQTRLQASRARAGGAATFRLLLLHQDDTPELRFWLLRTAGEVPPAAAREDWQDALEQRLELTGYELVRLTRPDQATPAWTWRYTREREQALRAALIGAMRGRRDLELQQLIHTIWRTPGFAGARAQVKKLRALIASEWTRARGAGEPLPELPARIGYVQRLPDIGRRLSELAGAQRGRRRGPADPEPRAATPAAQDPAEARRAATAVALAMAQAAANEQQMRDLEKDL